MSTQRAIATRALSSIFDSIAEWLDEQGEPLTDEQKRLIADLLAGTDWQGLAPTPRQRQQMGGVA